MTPNDRIKITKYKNHIRCDSTFAGYEGLKIVRKDMSSIYNPVGLKLTEELSVFNNSLAFIVRDLKVYTLPVVFFTNVIYIAQTYRRRKIISSKISDRSSKKSKG